MADEILIGSDGAATLDFKRVAVSAASDGSNEVVAAVTGKSIRVMGGCLTGNATGTTKFQSATTDLTGAMAFVNGSHIPLPWSPCGHVETAVSEALNLNNSAGEDITGWLTYVLR